MTTLPPSPLERGLGGEARNDIHINHVHNNNLEVAIVLAKDNNSIPPLTIHGEGVPAKRAGERSDKAVNTPSRNNRRRRRAY